MILKLLVLMRLLYKFSINPKINYILNFLFYLDEADSTIYNHNDVVRSNT